MNSIETNAVPPENLADLEAVVAAVSAGKRPDPELVRRVRERSRKATAAVLRRCGELNIAVDLIRETRDGV
jgi:hypothetical protein